MVQCWVCFNRVQLELCVVSYSLWMTVAAHSVFPIPLLFNCFTSACTGLRSFPLSLPLSLSHTHTQMENNISSPSLSSPVFWLLNQSCSLCLVGSSQDHPYGPLRHTRSAVWVDRERGEMRTEWRDGVRYKNVKRRRMLNEHHRGCERHTASTLTCVPVSGSSSSPFSLLISFRGGFPAPGPKT